MTAPAGRALAPTTMAMLQALAHVALAVTDRGGQVISLNGDGGVCEHRPLGVLVGVRMPVAVALDVLLDVLGVEHLESVTLTDCACRLFEGDGFTAAGPTRITLAVFDDDA